MPTRAPRPPDVDLTGGFRLDLKTGVLLLGLAASWYNQGSKIDAVRQKVEDQETSRTKISQLAQEGAIKDQQATTAALAELRGQVKLMAMDITDLKTALAVRAAVQQLNHSGSGKEN